VRFESFTIDVQRWRLLHDGALLDLSPRLVEILAFLAVRAGDTVTKDQLLDRFWPDVHVTENTVTRAIADIRQVLADDSRAPRVIQTVARHGYRFIAQLQPSDAAAPDTRRDLSDPYAAWVRGRVSLEGLEGGVCADPLFLPFHGSIASARVIGRIAALAV